jgi:hypothetical protein
MRYLMNCCHAQPVRAARDALPKVTARHLCYLSGAGGNRTIERDLRVVM